MKIYLDNCCYNRPFDDQNQERVYLESEAILLIIKRAEKKEDVIAGSAILDLERERIKDPRRKGKVKELYDITELYVPYTADIRKRSQEIMGQSAIRAFDSAHIASAEAAGAQVMLTTDDKLEKRAAKLNLQVRVMNPIKYMLEVF